MEGRIGNWCPTAKSSPLGKLQGRKKPHLCGSWDQTRAGCDAGRWGRSLWAQHPTSKCGLNEADTEQENGENEAHEVTGMLGKYAKPNIFMGWAIVIKYHTLGGLTKMYFLTVLEAGSSSSRWQQGWVLLKPLSLACRWPFSPCVLTRSSLCVCLCPNQSLLRAAAILD